MQVKDLTKQKAETEWFWTSFEYPLGFPLAFAVFTRDPKFITVDAQNNWSISADSIDVLELWYMWKAFTCT